MEVSLMSVVFVVVMVYSKVNVTVKEMLKIVKVYAVETLKKIALVPVVVLLKKIAKVPVMEML